MIKKINPTHHSVETVVQDPGPRGQNRATNPMQKYPLTTIIKLITLYNAAAVIRIISVNDPQVGCIR